MIFNMTDTSGGGGGVTVEALSVNTNGTYTAPTGKAYSPVTVNVSGGGAVEAKDVNFYDYDGTLLHSYTAAEAQALTVLPELPTREGLICQGWNYDLATIKEYNGAVDVGALYITDDGKIAYDKKNGAPKARTDADGNTLTEEMTIDELVALNNDDLYY